MEDPDYNPVVPPHVPPSLVHDFNLYDYQSRDPFEAVHALFKQGVPELFWTRNLGGHWIVLGAGAISEVDRNKTLFSTKRMFVPDVQNPDPPFFIPLQADLPMHTVYRGLITPLFTPDRISIIQERVRQTSEELIEQILQSNDLEFIRDYAAVLPVVIFLTLTDLPLADRDRLRAIAHRVLDPSDDVNRSAPIQDLVDYLTPVIDQRIEFPGEDVFSKIITQGIQERGLARDEVIKLSCTLLVGGLDTVTAALTYFAQHLANHPADRRRLIEEPEVLPRAIEEILRRYPVSIIGRQFTEDTTFRGVEVRRDDHILWSVGMSNFDERVFQNPLAVDFDRKRAPHATFGAGIHFCPGASLARTELRIFAETWLARIPEFHVPPGAGVKYKDGHTITLRALPLSIGPNPIS